MASYVLVVCGVPGSGKTTFARHVASRWNAIVFDSDVFLEQLFGPSAGRTSSGDFGEEALESVYAAMSAAAAATLDNAAEALVLLVGSFRSQKHRDRARALAARAGIGIAVLEIGTRIEDAIERVAVRIEGGGTGPDRNAIVAIGEALSAAHDIDIRVDNGGSREAFEQSADMMLGALHWTIKSEGEGPEVLIGHLEEAAATEFKRAAELIESHRRRLWPPDRISLVLRARLSTGTTIAVTPLPQRRARVDVPSGVKLDAIQALLHSEIQILSSTDAIVVQLPVFDEPAKLQVWEDIVVELDRARDRIRELRNLSLLGSRAIHAGEVEAIFQKATDKWVNAIDQVGASVLGEIG